MSIGLSFILIELALGAAGLALAKLLLPDLSRLRPSWDRAALAQAVRWSLAPVAFGMLLASPWGGRLPGLGSIQRLFAEGPLARFAGETGLLTLALFALAAGATEELLFRGVLQARFGLAAACLLFAAAHSVSWVLFLVALALGAYLGAAYERSGRNLVVPALAHASCDLAFLLTLRYAR
jgi:membrane protease YdiL (CAAX protease family)